MKYILVFIFLVFIQYSYSQNNYVPNGDFENYNNCPNIHSSIVSYNNSFVTINNWFYPGDYPSAEYYNKCDSSNSIWSGVPKNWQGYQNAKSGNGYIGIGVASNYLFTGEAVECELNKKLGLQNIYQIVFYVSLANLANSTIDSLKDNFWNVAMTNKHLKISFSDTLFYWESSKFEVTKVKNLLCVDTNKFYADTNKWMKVSGFYKSNGNEKFMIIGDLNMTDSLPRQLLYKIPGTNFNHDNSWYSYYYIDDVSVIDVTHFISGDSTICKGTTNALTTIVHFDKYNWNTGDTTKQIIINKAGWYWCLVSEGCDSHIDSFLVTQSTDSVDVLPVNLGENISSCIGDIEYWPQKIGLQTNINITDRIKWNTTILDNEFAEIFINQTGNYWVTAYNYCFSKSDTILVSGCPPKTPNIFAPNIFTPNDDGINDVFAIQAKYVNMQSLTIFDRWGNLVHEDKIYFNWAGFSKGKRCDVGTYYYIIKYTDGNNDKIKVYSDDVVLVR